MRVLLDTNVLVSAILFGGTPRRLMEAASRGELELVTSPGLLAELERVLLRKFEFASTVTSSIRGELEALCMVVEVAALPEVVADPADDEVLAAAIGGAQFVVTGDKELLDVGTHQQVTLVSPARFLEMWQERP